MDFYDDLRFLFGGKKLQCNAWIDKVFSDYYVLDYCEAGSFLHAVGDEELVEFTGPVAWLTYAGPRYRFGWPQKDRSWVHRCVAFSGVRADRYLAHGLFPADVQRIPIKVEDPTFFSHRMDEILTHIESERGSHVRAVQCLEGLLFELQRPHPASMSELFEAITGIKEEINAAPEIDWDFRQLASRLSISYHHFRRVWKEMVGQPPQDYLIAQRLVLAARRLRMEQGPIKQIVYESGFRDPAYFCRRFSLRYGMSPRAFRHESQI